MGCSIFVHFDCIAAKGTVVSISMKSCLFLAITAGLIWAVPRSGAAPPAADKAAKSVAVLIQQGIAALSNQDYKAARDTFSDAMVLQPFNSGAMAGLGMSYAGLKEYAKAEPLLDRAAMANPNNRVLAYDAAAAHIDNHSAMRGAKILRDYLQSHPATADEPMANAMAIALGQADEQARKNSFYQSVCAFYKTYNAKLEAANPGMKRWGIEWISAADFAEKQADIASKQKELEDANQALDQSDQKLSSLKSELPTMQKRVQLGWDSQYTLDELNTRISTQQDEETKKVADRDALLATIPQPSLPTALDLVTASTIPPAAIATVALADNTTPAVEAEPKAKPRAKKPSRPIPIPGGLAGAAAGNSAGGAPNGSAPSQPNASDPPIVFKPNTGGAPTPEAPATDAPTPDPQPAAPVRQVPVVQYAAAFPVAPDLLITAATPLVGATKIELTTPDGNPMHAELVRSDEASGLALLRLTGQTMAYLALATDFRGGAIQCAAFPSVDLFNPTVEMISGSAPTPADGWKVRLGKQPRLPGAPLLALGKVVGVQLADRDSPSSALPAATLSQLRAFLGSDLPTTPGTASPASVLLQLSATKGGD
jgi:tetratricopeptide (TPR) repeat protein